MSLSNDATLTMPVAPAYQANGNGNSMWGGDWSSWIILFLIFGLFGGWGNGIGGWGGNGGANSPGFQGLATRADINEGFALNGLQNGQTSIRDAVSNGFHGVDNAICNLGYQTQQGFNSLGTQMAQCCCDTTRAIDQVNFQTAQGLNNLGSQIASCCCDTQRQIERGFCDTNYNLATNTTSIIQNAHNDTDRVIAKLDAMEATRQQERIAALQAENQSLRFQASQSAQNAFITANQEAQTAELIRRINPSPVPAYQVPNPYTGCCGFNSCSCGC